MNIQFLHTKCIFKEFKKVPKKCETEFLNQRQQDTSVMLVMSDSNVTKAQVHINLFSRASSMALGMTM